ncbi:MAG: hypothetical protein ACFFDN_48410 [Candidatus Hodarchaeota archaeon]
MFRKKDAHQKDEKVILNWLAHHNPMREDFDDHVFYIFNHAICIGCSAFILGGILALLVGNIFYYYIINFINLPIILMIFFFCMIPSIFQYLIQIIRKKPLRNRAIKFLIRFLYPVGSIIFIFHSPLWGFSLSIPAGYLIIYIRKIKNRVLKEI